MGEGGVDFRYHLEVGGSEEGPELETHSRKMKAPGGDQKISDSTAGGQETEGQ